MKTVTMQDFLTTDEIKYALELWQSNSRGFASRVHDQIIKPNLARINKALGQENDPMYLAYAMEYIMLCAEEGAVGERVKADLCAKQDKEAS